MTQKQPTSKTMQSYVCLLNFSRITQNSWSFQPVSSVCPHWNENSLLRAYPKLILCTRIELTSSNYLKQNILPNYPWNDSTRQSKIQYHTNFIYPTFSYEFLNHPTIKIRRDASWNFVTAVEQQHLEYYSHPKQNNSLFCDIHVDIYKWIENKYVAKVTKSKCYIIENAQMKEKQATSY